MSQPDFKPVYILGAGASKMLGGPLINDFLKRARELRYSSGFAAGSSRAIDRAALFDKVSIYQGKLLKTKAFVATDMDNLEVLFSMLDMDYQVHSAGQNEVEHKVLKDIRECFLAVIIQTLKDSVQMDGGLWGNYVRTLKFLALTPESVFITFNYDLAIETALEDGSVLPGEYQLFVKFGTSEQDLPTEKKERLLLKLHGSADWTFCDECKAFKMLRAHGMQYRYAIPQEYESISHLLHSKSCKNHPLPVTVLIPPTWHKANYPEIITHIWYTAIKEISGATHLFIIGYSFPRTDVFFDQLLALGLRDSKNLKQVVVVNKSESVRPILDNFFEDHFLRRSVDFIELPFEEFALLVSAGSHAIATQAELEKVVDNAKERAKNLKARSVKT